MYIYSYTIARKYTRYIKSLIQTKRCFIKPCKGVKPTIRKPQQVAIKVGEDMQDYRKKVSISQLCNTSKYT